MADKRKVPELLAPAGDWERLRMAVLYGADAVYLAGTAFGMRAFAGNFSPEELPKAVAFAHEHGVKVHCTVNTMPRNNEVVSLPAHLELLQDAGVDALILADLGVFALAGTACGMRAFAGNFSPEELPKAVAFAHEHGVKVHCTVNTMPRNSEVVNLPAHLELLQDAGVDALILADLGVFALAGKYAPRCERHVSTQQSIANYECARAWHDLGASRVVLARELSLTEIAEIRARTPKELEIETFCHGAMCVSYSGRCLLSNYMTGRDSNRGECAQPCRYQYALMEEKRPGEYFPVFEDEKGSYIMNSRDMCTIDHLPELRDAGVDCLKIEGRAKSAYYAAIVTGAYRHGLDAAAEGREMDPVWRDEVEHVSHRPYSTGFLFGPPGQYYATSRYLREWQVVALVTDCDEAGNATLSLRNKFRAGEELEAVGPDTRPFAFTAPEIFLEDGTPVEEPKTPQTILKMKLPQAVPAWSLLRRRVELSAK